MAYLSRLRESVPTACPLCECASRGGDLCMACDQRVLRSLHTSGPRCPVCQLVLAQDGSCADCRARAPAFDRVVVAFDYTEPGDFLVHRLKSGHRFVLAPMLARLLARAARQARLPGNTILAPVPASRAGILQRGFNPAAEIARHLARQLNLSCQPALLRRTREGIRQAALPRAERMRNAHSLYDCGRRVD